MDAKTVTLRLAQQQDAVAIWHLLHSDSKTISINRITEAPENFIVLCHEAKLVAVCDNPLNDADQTQGIVVHPLYPRKLLADAVINIVKVLFQDNGFIEGGRISWKKKLKLWI